MQPSRGIRTNRAKVVVIDPVRTRTAKQADWHIAIRPGTDGALALGMMHVIIAEDLVDHDYVEASGATTLAALEWIRSAWVSEIAQRTANFPEPAEQRALASMFSSPMRLSREQSRELFAVVQEQLLKYNALNRDEPATMSLPWRSSQANRYSIHAAKSEPPITRTAPRASTPQARITQPLTSSRSICAVAKNIAATATMITPQTTVPGRTGRASVDSVAGVDPAGGSACGSASAGPGSVVRATYVEGRLIGVTPTQTTTRGLEFGLPQTGNITATSASGILGQ